MSLAALIIVTIILVINGIAFISYTELWRPGKLNEYRTMEFLPGSCTLADGFFCTEFRVLPESVVLSVKNTLSIDVENAHIAMHGGCEDEVSVGTLGKSETKSVELWRGALH